MKDKKLIIFRALIVSFLLGVISYVITNIISYFQVLSIYKDYIANGGAEEIIRSYQAMCDMQITRIVMEFLIIAVLITLVILTIIKIFKRLTYSRLYFFSLIYLSLALYFWEQFISNLISKVTALNNSIPYIIISLVCFIFLTAIYVLLATKEIKTAKP